MSRANFTGANRVSVVNWGVMKRGMVLGSGLLMVCASILAQSTTEISLDELSRYRPEMLSPADYLALLQNLPMLAFANQELLPANSDLGAPTVSSDQTFPRVYVSATKAKKVNTAYIDAKDSPKSMKPIEPDPLQIHGQISTFYGHSTGKSGGDAFGSYLESTIGNDKFQFTIGTSYDQFNGRVPRRSW
jgi:hypothetical protein